MRDNGLVMEEMETMETTPDTSNEPPDASERQPYRLPDMSVGKPGGPWPLGGMAWGEIRDLIYGEWEPGKELLK